MTVPLVMTPMEVYIGPLGFFLTPIISKLNVHFSSGWVMWALVKRRPIGLINRSYLGGFRVKPGPTNVTLVTSRFHCLAVIHHIIIMKISILQKHCQKGTPKRTYTKSQPTGPYKLMYSRV